jgi:adhesin/invasin
VADQGGGRYVATLTSATTEGVAQVSATLDGSAFATPVAVAFVGGPPTAATSTLTAAPTTIVANGTSTSTLTLQLRDANGNPTAALQDEAVAFITTAGTLGPVTNPETGVYVVALTSTTEGVANVTATLGGTAFAGPASVTFVAGPAAGVRLVGPTTGTALIPAPLTLTIVDALGNTTTSTSAELFTLTSSGILGLFIPSSPITIPAGSASTTFTFTGFQNNGARTITATWSSGGPTPLGSASHQIRY